MNLHGIELEPYEPTEQDLEFTKNLMTMLRMNGIWGSKSAGLIYQKTSAVTLKLLDIMPTDDQKLKQLQAVEFNAMKACCKKLGYEVDESILETT